MCDFRNLDADAVDGTGFILGEGGPFLVDPADAVDPVFFQLAADIIVEECLARNFVAFGNCYVPTEELLDRERGNGETDDDEQTTAENCASQSAADCEQSAQRLSAERSAFIQAALDKRVAYCNKMTGAGLSPEDEQNISAYLAQRYYKFAP